MHRHEQLGRTEGKRGDPHIPWNLEYEKHGPTGGLKTERAVENNDPESQTTAPLNKENLEQLCTDRPNLTMRFEASGSSSSSSHGSSPASSPSSSCHCGPPTSKNVTRPLQTTFSSQEQINGPPPKSGLATPQLWFPTSVKWEELGDASQFPPGQLLFFKK
jgi:hypothetical protein